MDEGATMRTTLQQTLVAIAAERPHFDQSFRLVKSLLAEVGEDDLAERLDCEIPQDVPWEFVADLFGILEWSTRDNGAALTRVTEDWLRDANDLRRIRIALHLDSYPFLDEFEMERVRRDVALRHPPVAARSHELIESRRLESARIARAQRH